MLGAICGDILGSTYEFGIEGQEVSLIHERDQMTDDSVLTCAVAEWMLEDGNDPALGKGEQKYLLAKKFLDYTLRYVDKAYGLQYADWILNYEETGQMPEPPNSLGNGSAMRVSPIAYGYRTLEEVEQAAKLQAEITHNHSEGIRGACAVAAAVKLALDEAGKETIRNYVSSRYDYDLSRSLEEIRVKNGAFSATCPVTVPQAFAAFFAGKDYESTILHAIRIGGDCDTVAAMAGSMAYAYYKKIPEYLLEHCFSCMDEQVQALWRAFENRYIAKRSG